MGVCSCPLQEPIRWPKSRDEVWKANVPHPFLSSYKANQNWMVVKGDKIEFPGGGTHFPEGAPKYIEGLGKVCGGTRLLYAQPPSVYGGLNGLRFRSDHLGFGVWDGLAPSKWLSHFPKEVPKSMVGLGHGVWTNLLSAQLLFSVQFVQSQFAVLYLREQYQCSI